MSAFFARSFSIAALQQHLYLFLSLSSQKVNPRKNQSMAFSGVRETNTCTQVTHCECMWIRFNRKVPKLWYNICLWFYEFNDMISAEGTEKKTDKLATLSTVTHFHSSFIVKWILYVRFYVLISVYLCFWRLLLLKII
jgi:hypothetical protein